MKKEENIVIKILNDSFNTSLKSCDDQYSSYDAEDKNYIVEIKVRNKYYQDKLIEAMKLYSNFHKAQIKGKFFLYVVKDPKGFYIYNINKIIDKVINSKLIPFKCPISTEFNREGSIVKYSYTLPEDLAIIYQEENN